GPRDRAPDGRRHPGRPVHVDAAQPVRRALAVPALRQRGVGSVRPRRAAELLYNPLRGGRRMSDWTRSMVPTATMVGASMLCLLPASPARAQQGPAAEDLDALKRKVDEVISQNEELRRRVRELEEAMSKRGPAPSDPAAAGEPPKAPASQAATTPPSEPLKTAKGSAIQLGGAIEMEGGARRSFR